MERKKVGQHEYQLMNEEIKRGCVPCYLGIVQSGGRILPAIVLRQKLDQKEKYVDTAVRSSWALAQNMGIPEVVYLEMIFPHGKVNIFIDRLTSDEIRCWFKLLILSSGELVLNDTVNDVKAISISGIPLDVPSQICGRSDRLNVLS